MKRVFVLIALILFSVTVGKGWHFVKDRFQMRRTYFPLQGHSQLNPGKDVIEGLSQPFFYLGRGHQCYAFSSKDDRFVLKLL